MTNAKSQKTVTMKPRIMSAKSNPDPIDLRLNVDSKTSLAASSQHPIYSLNIGYKNIVPL